METKVIYFILFNLVIIFLLATDEFFKKRPKKATETHNHDSINKLSLENINLLILNIFEIIMVLFVGLLAILLVQEQNFSLNFKQILTGSGLVLIYFSIKIIKFFLRDRE